MLLSSSVWRERAKWWFSAGLLLGGAVAGLVAVTLGSLLRPIVPAPVAVLLTVSLGVIIGLGEFGVYRLPLPQNARQVPEWIIDDGGKLGALQFGFEMGTGVRTYMTSGTPHLLLMTTVLFADLGEGVLAGALFGAGRAWMALSRLHSGGPEEWDRRLAHSLRPVRLSLVVTAFVCCLVLVVTSGSTGWVMQ